MASGLGLGTAVDMASMWPLPLWDVLSMSRTVLMTYYAVPFHFHDIADGIHISSQCFVPSLPGGLGQSRAAGLKTCADFLASL